MKIKGNILLKVTNKDIKNGTFIIPNSVTEIGNFAFLKCTSLSSINIPNSVTIIGNGAFQKCKNLKFIYIPDSVTYIGYSAFYNCENLESINIPDNITYIDKCTFKDCTNLKSINIPDSVTEIRDWAFRNCINLTSINMSKNIECICENAFADCPNLIKKGNFKACNIIRDENKIMYSCRGTIFEIGKQMHVINNIECGKIGYHYCENLYDIFNYYHGDLNNIALFEIEPGNVIIKDKYDSKCITNTMTLVRQIPWNEVFGN